MTNKFLEIIKWLYIHLVEKSNKDIEYNLDVSKDQIIVWCHYLKKAECIYISNDLEPITETFEKIQNWYKQRMIISDFSKCSKI